MALALAALLVPSVGALAAPTPWVAGDLFVGISNGQYEVYSNAGVFKETISNGVSFNATGCAFNPAQDRLYTTSFEGNRVIVFGDALPHSVVQSIDTSTTGGLDVESIVFAGDGQFYVGHADGNGNIQRFNSAGVLQQSYVETRENRGSDWVELSANQRTVFYTSEGHIVKRFDVSGAGAQLADFSTTLPGNNAYALRLLPPFDGTGGLLVADTNAVVRLNGAGAVVQTYPFPGGAQILFALNLDPNGTSFWTADLLGHRFARFNIATGAVEVGPITSGGSQIGGLCLKGEITGATQGLSLSPTTATNPTGTPHTVTATATSNGAPAPGTTVAFVVSGANTAAGSCVTTAGGTCDFTYTGTNVGNDTITATATIAGNVKTATATKTWTPGAKTPHSLALNGIDGYADAAHSADLNITGNWTVETWFKDEDPAGFNHDFRQIIMKGDRALSNEAPYYILIGRGSILAGVRTGGTDYPDVVSLAGFDPTKWHHVAATFRADLNVINVWLDGVHQNYFLVPTHSTVGNTLPLNIGRNGPVTGKYWMGKLDDLRVWNIARTGTAITASYQTQFTGSPPANLVANWQFDENGGVTAPDYADSHPATLHGGAAFSTDVHP